MGGVTDAITVVGPHCTDPTRLVRCRGEHSCRASIRPRLYFSGSSCRWIQAARQLDVDVLSRRRGRRRQSRPRQHPELRLRSTWPSLHLSPSSASCSARHGLATLGPRTTSEPSDGGGRCRFVAVAAGVPRPDRDIRAIDLGRFAAAYCRHDAPRHVDRVVEMDRIHRRARRVVRPGPRPHCSADVAAQRLRSGTSVIDRRLGQIDRGDTSGRNAPNASGLGICASRGGIRSASVMIGAFRGPSDRGIFQRAQWLHAVSGGGYAAGGWRVSSISQAEDDGHEDSGRASEPEENLFAPDHPWFEHVRSRRRVPRQRIRLVARRNRGSDVPHGAGLRWGARCCSVGRMDGGAAHPELGRPSRFQQRRFGRDQARRIARMAAHPSRTHSVRVRCCGVPCDSCDQLRRLPSARGARLHAC